MTRISNPLANQVYGKTAEHILFFSETLGINKAMLKSYRALETLAKKSNIEIKVASGFRSFDRQIQIWNNKVAGKTTIKDKENNIIDTRKFSELELVHAILLYTALPGASRHHWGCDIDIYAPNLIKDNYQLKLEPWEYYSQGPFAKLSQWLKLHGSKFGFYFPYDKYRGGVAEEPWHLSYAPLAEVYQSAFNIDELAQCIEQSDMLAKKTVLDNLHKFTQMYINNVAAIPKYQGVIHG